MSKIFIGVLAAGAITTAMMLAEPAKADDDMTVIKQYEKFGACAIKDGIVVNVRMGAKIYSDVSSGGKAGGGGENPGVDGTGGVAYTRQATKQFMYITIQCPTKAYKK